MQDMVLRTPSINGEIELLLSLAEKEATVHVALAAHYGRRGSRGRQKASGTAHACVSMPCLNSWTKCRGEARAPVLLTNRALQKWLRPTSNPPASTSEGVSSFAIGPGCQNSALGPQVTSFSLSLSLWLALALALVRARARALALSDTRAAAAHGAQVVSAGRVCGAVVGACACLCVNCAMQWPPRRVACARKCAEQVLIRRLCEQICSTNWMPSLQRLGRFRRIVASTQPLLA